MCQNLNFIFCHKGYGYVERRGSPRRQDGQRSRPVELRPSSTISFSGFSIVEDAHVPQVQGFLYDLSPGEGALKAYR